MWHSSLFLMPFFSCSFIEPRTTHPGVEPHSMRWTLLYPLPSNSMSYGLTHWPICWGAFSQLKSPFPKWLLLVSGSHETSQHTSIRDLLTRFVKLQVQHYEDTFHMCPRASFLLWGPDPSTMMCLSGTRPGNDRIIPHHRGWLSGPLHRVPWLLLHVRHDRTCFWDVSHTQSEGNHKQIITHNHSLNKQKGGKLLSTLPISLESSTPLSTQWQATDDDRLSGPLGPASSGDECTPIFCLSRITDQDMRGLGSVILLLSGIEVVRKTTSP